MTKRCCTCKTEKELSEFHHSKSLPDGRTRRCKVCQIKACGKIYERNRNRETIPIQAEKRCRICSRILPSTEFHRNTAIKGGLASYCKPCAIDKARNHYKENRDSHNQKSREWGLAHPQAKRDHSKGYKTRNREKYLAAARDYAKRNKKAARERLWANPERLGRFREMSRAAASKRRARKKGNMGEFTAEEFASLCSKHGGKCLRCGRSVKMTADHVFPINLGGSNNISNIQPLCLECNSGKGARVVDYRPETMDLDDIGLDAAA